MFCRRRRIPSTVHNAPKHHCSALTYSPSLSPRQRLGCRFWRCRKFRYGRVAVKFSCHAFVIVRRCGLLTQVRIEVVCLFGGLVVGNQIGDHFSRLVELVQVVGKRCSLLVTFHEGVSLSHPVVLLHNFLEQLQSLLAEGHPDPTDHESVLPQRC